MIKELTMLLSGRALTQIRDAAIQSYGYRWHKTIHQAIDIYMHWVILGMELEHQALGYIYTSDFNRLNYKTTFNHIYTQQNTVPGTHRIKQLHTPLPHSPLSIIPSSFFGTKRGVESNRQGASA